MKTLVLSLPRMGSKQITFNLYRYLKARYGTVSEIYPVRDIEPSLDELFNTGHHRFKCTLVRENNNLIRTDNIILSLSDELDNRKKLVYELDGPYVIKHFPIVDRSITDFLLNCVDNTYVLHREDIFSTALSTCIGIISHSWIKSDFQQMIIDDWLRVPIVVPAHIFSERVMQSIRYKKTFCTNNARKIEFNDICAATNSYEFCKLMDLEYIDFDFIMLGKEFGDNKEQMVSNIDELKGIYDKLTYQCLY
jgi:hypothetical protein